MFTAFSLRKSREFTDAMQAFDGVVQTAERQRANRGTRAFRSINGHDYLVSPN